MGHESAHNAFATDGAVAKDELAKRYGWDDVWQGKAPSAPHSETWFWFYLRAGCMDLVCVVVRTCLDMRLHWCLLCCACVACSCYELFNCLTYKMYKLLVTQPNWPNWFMVHQVVHQYFFDSKPRHPLKLALWIKGHSFGWNKARMVRLGFFPGMDTRMHLGLLNLSNELGLVESVGVNDVS